MREERTDIPGLVLSEQGASRVAFMPADIDRRYAAEHLPDHATLLANVTRWAAGDRLPLTVDGPGLIDCHLYEQPSRLILHLVNLTSEATWRAPLDELIPRRTLHREDPRARHRCAARPRGCWCRAGPVRSRSRTAWPRSPSARSSITR